MSRNELIDAYRRGRISRRTFVQGMTAVGVSAVAATAMADRFRNAAAAAPNAQTDDDDDDVYGTATVPVASPTARPTTGTGGGTTTLPNTGSGADDAGGSFWKPVAVAGAAAAAFVAAKYRKVRGAEVE